jgi:hypothetical protein
LNLAYHEMTANMDSKARAEIDRLLAPPEEREAIIGRQNREAMQALAGFGLGPPPPTARGKAG